MSSKRFERARREEESEGDRLLEKFDSGQRRIESELICFRSDKGVLKWERVLEESGIE